MAKVCIICEQEKSGYAVADDVVITAIRWFKNAFGVAKNNTLVVCKECLPAHSEKRAKFEKNLTMHVIFAAVLLLALIFFPIFTGAGISLYPIFLGVVLAILIVALAGIYHWPRTVDNVEKQQGGIIGAKREPSAPPALEKKKGRKK